MGQTKLHMPYSRSLPDLVQSEDRYSAVKDALKIFNKMDLEKLIAAVCYVYPRCSSAIPKAFQLAASETRILHGAKPASTRVAQMLTLRAAVRNLPAISRALEGSLSVLLETARNVWSVLPTFETSHLY